MKFSTRCPICRGRALYLMPDLIECSNCGPMFSFGSLSRSFSPDPETSMESRRRGKFLMERQVWRMVIGSGD